MKTVVAIITHCVRLFARCCLLLIFVPVSLILSSCLTTSPCSISVNHSANSFTECRTDQHDLIETTIALIGVGEPPSLEFLQNRLEMVQSATMLDAVFTDLESQYNYSHTEELTVESPAVKLELDLRYHKVSIARHSSPEITVELTRTDKSNYSLSRTDAEGVTKISVKGDFINPCPFDCGNRSTVRVNIPYSGIERISVNLEIGSVLFDDLGIPTDITVNSGGMTANRIHSTSSLSIDSGSIYVGTLDNGITVTLGDSGALYAIEAPIYEQTVTGAHAIVEQFETDLTATNAEYGVTGYVRYGELSSRRPAHSWSRTYTLNEQTDSVSLIIRDRGIRFVFLHFCDKETVTAILEQSETGGFELEMCHIDSQANIFVSGAPTGGISALPGDMLGAVILFVPRSIPTINIQYLYQTGIDGVVFGPDGYEDRVSISGGSYRPN